VTAAAAATFACGLASAVAHADEPALVEPTPPESTVVDGVLVAVDVPPVPSTEVVVAVAEPPVPPTSVVAVAEPPVPPATVADAEPPVPPATVPDAEPAVAQQLPETGAAAARATAIVATAAASIGAALRALANRP
jgi:hypothetical protein